ncbi:hypothetical protein CPC08DRAFT_218732 [Agrocybe pediades]|nr:hypothetical protein CPC08DRAFT_218732 [Agrocybe pediades]
MDRISKRMCPSLLTFPSFLFFFSLHAPAIPTQLFIGQVRSASSLASFLPCVRRRRRQGHGPLGSHMAWEGEVSNLAAGLLFVLLWLGLELFQDQGYLCWDFVLCFFAQRLCWVGCSVTSVNL